MTYNELRQKLRERALLGGCGPARYDTLDYAYGNGRQYLVKVTVPLTGEPPKKPKAKITSTWEPGWYHSTSTGTSSSTSYTYTSGGWY